MPSLDLVQAYQHMLLIRLFEDEVNKLFEKGLVHGTTHLSIGQEAVAVGACMALGPDDYVTSTHRGHGHMLAKGASPRRMLAEILGRQTGYCGGRGGSQHIAWMEGHFLGCNGITGGGIPIATGAALHIRNHRLPLVSICFFGDGAANQGTFHESLNMAAIWRLPVIYICENNLYAMSMPIQQAVAVEHIASRATAYGIPGAVVEGNQIWAVYDAVRLAVDRARRGEGPTLIECLTYRWMGHSRGDPRVYRSRDEETLWRQRDPVLMTRGMLEEQGVPPELLAHYHEVAQQAISDAVDFAVDSPFPTA